MSTNVVYQMFADKMGGRHVESFIADKGLMFYDPNVGELRLGTGDIAGGISLFKALASDMGLSADGGDSIQNGFNVLVYDGGNATSPFNIYDVVDGNTSPLSVGFNENQQYNFANVVTFANTVTVNGVEAGGSLGTSGQVLTSTGYVAEWKTPVTGVTGISNNTTLGYDAANPSVVSDSSNATVVVANSASFNIPNFSGMLIVNDHYDGGVALYIAGGGSGVLVSNTNSAFDTGLTMNNNGYDWTNSTNLLGPFTFTVIKTRSGS